jgi:CDP-diacylglycerol---serine O-phosphatidyltransferase
MARRRRQYLYLLPNSVTGLGLFLGLWAIMLVIDSMRDNTTQALMIAAWWVILASLIDGLDGQVARMTGTTSNFGIQFDSLADLVTFGLAPAMILYAVIFPWNSSVATGVAATYAMCGAVRLARFNIGASTASKKKAFQGLPIPAAGGMVVSLILCHGHIERLLGTDTTRRLLPIVALVAAYLMISNMRFRTFRELAFRSERNVKTATVQVLAFVVLMAALMIMRHEILALLVFGGYVIYSVTAALAWHWRLVRHPLEQEQDKENEV